MNGYFNNPTMGMNGMTYAQPMMGYFPQNQQPLIPKMTNPLTPEDYSLLNKGGQFTIAVTPEEVAAAKCTHKKNGQFSVIENGDGTVTCTVCGATFSPVAKAVEEVSAAVGTITDILQTIKLTYLDVPEQMATEYYPIIPLIEKLPKLYQIAQNNLSKYMQNNNNPMQQMNPQMNAFSMLGAAASGAYGNYGYGMAPQMGMGMPAQTPVNAMGQQMPFAQQPQYDPSVSPMGIAQNVMPQAQMNPMMQGNPFQAPMQGMGMAPQMGMPQAQYGFAQPQANIPQYAQAPNPTTAPAAAPAGETVTVSQELKV